MESPPATGLMNRLYFDPNASHFPSGDRTLVALLSSGIGPEVQRYAVRSQRSWRLPMVKVMVWSPTPSNLMFVNESLAGSIALSVAAEMAAASLVLSNSGRLVVFIG